MLLEYAADNKPFNDDKYITELKWDGIRLVPRNINRPRLYTRHENEITANFPELIESMPIPSGTILDSELVVPNAEGKADFAATMERFQSSKSKHKVTIVAFDIIKYKNRDMTYLPLTERKKYLEDSFVDNDYFVKSRYLTGKGIEYFNAVKQQGLEGIVLKRADSKYIIGKKSKYWQKVIAYEMGEFYLAGFRKDKFGWLLSDGNGIVGTMEYGPNSEERKAGYLMMKKYKTEETKDYVYTQPLMRCLVKHRGFTKNGMLRLPVFERFLI
ncbi:DNA ligase-1 [Paenibacillus sophorae]|nr:DNA ligase-1 [Paenibacillus sophorae]